jgi:hypothetical protein
MRRWMNIINRLFPAEPQRLLMCCSILPAELRRKWSWRS